MKNLFFNADKILSRNRYPWVDYARGICIILVVYRHVFEGLTNVGAGSDSYPVLKYFNIFFFSFRMPLFFIVSGIFLSSSLLRKKTGDYIKGRFNVIFYPLLIWGSIQVTLQLIFTGYVNASRSPIDYLNLLIDPRKIEQFWYLNALFCVSALYALVNHYLRFTPIRQLLLGTGFYILSAFIRLNDWNAGFLTDVLFFYLFFAIGDLVSDFIMNNRNYKIFTSHWTLLLILPVFIMMQHYFTRINMDQGNDYYVQFQRPDLYALTALVGCAFVMNLSFILQKLQIFRFLRVVGYHSLYIYVMHLMIAAAVRIIMVRLFHIENIPVVMVTCIAAGVILPVILFNLAERYGGWWLFALKKRKASPEKQPLLFLRGGLVAPRQSMGGEK